MVALASDRRVSGWRSYEAPSPAEIVLRYKQLIHTSHCSEMPYGIALKEMLEAVVKAEEAGAAVAIWEDNLTRFTSE